MRKIYFSLMSSILFVFMSCLSVSAHSFNDVKAQDWYYESVKLCYQSGILLGASEYNFNPQDSLTVKDTIVLASRLHQLYNKNPKIQATDRDWFNPYYQYALQNSIITKGESIDTSIINKEQFVVFIARALSPSNLININEMNTVPGYFSVDAYDQVLSFYRAGVLTGSDKYGTFTAYTPITRAEVSVILSRIINPSLRVSTSFESQALPTAQKIDISLDDLTITDFDDTYVYAKNLKSGEFCVFDLNGRQVIPYQNNEINKISDGVFRISSVDGLTHFYMNKEGVRLNHSTYGFATDFNEGFAIVMEKEGEPYVINKQGQTVRTISEEYFGLKLSDRYVYLADQGAVRLMKIQTGEVITLPYNEITPFINGIARVRYFEGDTSFSSLIDTSLTPLWSEKYAYVRGGTNYFPVMQDWNYSLYGVADRTGKLVVPVEFTEILANQNDMALFSKDNALSLRQINSGKVKLVLPNMDRIQYTLYDYYLTKKVPERNDHLSENTQTTIIDFLGREILQVETKKDMRAWFGRNSLIYTNGTAFFYLNLQ